MFINIENNKIWESKTVKLLGITIDKKNLIVTLYQSHSQNYDEFDEFLCSFESVIDHLNQSKLYFVLITGAFNAHSSSWWGNDFNNFEGISIENLISSYGFKQLIPEPTHLLPTSSSYTDLLFTNQPNMVMNSGVFPSIHQNCHHQIFFAKVNLNIFYPPPYMRCTWDYGKANHKAIKNGIVNFDWKKPSQILMYTPKLNCLMEL